VAEAIAALRAAGIRASLFIDARADQVRASRDAGGDAIEINTGAYADASAADRPRRLAEVRAAASAGVHDGLEVLAGHGLTYVNIHPIAAIREIVELNIGHSIVARAALVGLERAVREMVALLA
jgi:pyridoxine 5-phosphate synthase